MQFLFFFFLFPLRDNTTIEKTEKKNINIKHYSNILLCIKKNTWPEESLQEIEFFCILKYRIKEWLNSHIFLLEI